MTSHRNRMGEIGFWTVPPEDTAARAAFEKRFEKAQENPAYLKALKKTYDKAVALMEAQKLNGLGFPADEMLREFNWEYNSRVLNGSLRDMPGSFNVVEAFNKFLPPSSTFELRKESDHLFSFDDFIDYVTSDAYDESKDDIKDATENAVIYSYNSLSDPGELEFSVNTGEKYGFSSVSLVRFDDEVSMVLVGGQICDLQQKTEEIREVKPLSGAFPNRSHLAQPDYSKSHAVPLEGSSDLWKAVVLVRFDLQTKTIDARYVYQDCGNFFEGRTDDIDNYLDRNGKFFSPQLEEMYGETSKALDEYQALFELCKTCLLLPRYFRDHEEDIEIERHPTKFLEFRKKLKNAKAISLVNPVHCLAYREAHALPKKGRRSPELSSFYAPDYKIETSGYWKKLSVQAEGRDKNGRPIHGRTWVSQTLAWVEEGSTSSRNVVVEKKTKTPDSANSGYIYVMRSAAHEKDIFKVGLTRRTSDVRANELSRSTSSPDQFLVVEEWPVSDCVLAERMIHERLDQYRINPSREYFKARYNVIFSVIDEVIAELENS